MRVLRGHQAIEYAETHGLSLSKYADLMGCERDGLRVFEARDIASEDPELIYLVIKLKDSEHGTVGNPLTT